MSYEDGGWGDRPAPRCVYCGDASVVVVAVEEIDRPVSPTPKRRTFHYPLCDDCLEHAEAAGVVLNVLPDEPTRGL